MGIRKGISDPSASLGNVHLEMEADSRARVCRGRLSLTCVINHPYSDVVTRILRGHVIKAMSASASLTDAIGNLFSL